MCSVVRCLLKYTPYLRRQRYKSHCIPGTSLLICRHTSYRNTFSVLTYGGACLPSLHLELEFQLKFQLWISVTSVIGQCFCQSVALSFFLSFFFHSGVFHTASALIMLSLHVSFGMFLTPRSVLCLRTYRGIQCFRCFLFCSLFNVLHRVDVSLRSILSYSWLRF